MALPKFKRRLDFLGDTQAPCLRAALPNSIIPGLAIKEIEKVVDEPEFSVLLRAKNPKRITAWQKKQLEQLIEKGGLKSAIEEGMRDYFSKHPIEELPEAAKPRRKEVEAAGILPYVLLSDVVIDDGSKNILLVLSADFDAHLAEHGICIYLNDGQWKFDADYLVQYLDKVEEEESERESSDFEEEQDDAPPAKPTGSDDIAFLFGKWEHDPEAHLSAMKRDGEKDDQIRMTLEFFQGKAFEVSPETFVIWHKGRPQGKDKMLGIKVKGNKVAIKFEQTLIFRGVAEKEIKTWDLVYDGTWLTTGGAPFKKTTT